MAVSSAWRISSGSTLVAAAATVVPAAGAVSAAPDAVLVPEAPPAVPLSAAPRVRMNASAAIATRATRPAPAIHHLRVLVGCGVRAGGITGAAEGGSAAGWG